MKKIMFNDKFSLTQAVLEGRKTMTRRIIKCPRTFRGEWVAGFNIHRSPSDKKIVGFPCMYDADEREFDMGEILPKYELGEVVAIAQSYQDIDNYYYAALRRKTSIHGQIIDELDLVDIHDIIKWKSLRDDLMNTPGWTNKMFVKADLMPRHIEITGIKVERLQDISDEDYMKEGIEEHLKGIQYGFPSNIGYIGQYPFSNPREAFSALIDKVSGKGTWECNPFVWAYEFKLID
ncbi:hypothetical protein KSZ88_19365 [Bacteroides thetaiotaomicron]|jgi:hypothetical protein|uniref:ASCH domain-containing protein n=1 Tax=Bacteroides thetaiotaomicron TaxID=818 RepID=A0ABD7U4V1_BACT4|nr:hypothetical protein [Bacteroides thetaiotaomicron]MBU9009020.1 hypothetical protein [Bacteroides thetaiotaomicron]MBU9075305.1 hypothetical protein [Bacteroides thetaiotaomicron]MBV4263689.1 hypothetical protein [Bacteroides thetaiotaomicron]MCB7309807.1 hypothetical protein [Bacteroides thetaiotaomicron]MCG4873139.1 hypothetical protein [Bacteroides thetaiotaomicron]